MLPEFIGRRVLRSLGTTASTNLSSRVRLIPQLESTILDRFSGVTLLYSDIQGFTSYSASSSPQNVILMLSNLFTAFDKLTDEHNIYKIQFVQLLFQAPFMVDQLLTS
jgi:class 3 adenylate cyclase